MNEDQQFRSEETPTDDHSRLDMLWNYADRNSWAGGNLMRGEVPRIVTVDKTAFNALTAQVSYHRWFFLVPGGTAATDTLYVCIKNASDAYVFKNISDPTPTGVIVMWSGTIATIPAGWAICDGNNGTPNLLSKFIKGVATAATEPGTTGGATTHTHSNHTVTQPNDHAQTRTEDSDDNRLVASGSASNVASPDHGHLTPVLAHTGTAVSAHNSPNSEPPYYALAYIMKL